MNKMKALLTWMLLLTASHVMGVNVTVDPIEIEAGKTAQLVIKLSNTETNLTAYQMFLYLPNGVTVQKKSNGKYTYTINNNRHDGAFTVSVKDAEGGSVLITCFSADKDVITGTNGELIRLPLEVSSTVTASLQGSLKNIEFSDVNAKAYKPADVTFNMTLKTPVEPVTITADNKTMTYGDDVPTLTYKSTGAALNGTPKLSTTATKTSPVGTYPIKVEKGSVTNEAVTYVDGTLTISKAPLTIGVQNVTITEGDAIPAFTLTYSGFRNGDTESKAFTTKPTATTTATSSSKAGTYPITVSGGSATNYALTYTQGTLTIQKKSVEPVTITADNKTMTYGDDVPTLTYKSSGAKLNGTPKLSTTATKTSPVGTYPIKVEKGTVTNEAVTYVDGMLTISKASLTVGVQNVTITEGDAIPAFTLTYSGFRNGDTESKAFTTKPTATTKATSSSKAGTYPITVSGGSATDYALTYTQGTLTIKEKAGEPVTITANEITMVYGDEVPTLTYTSEGGALKGTPKLSTTATKTSPVGTYPIKVERGTVTNGQVTFVDGTLIITKAPLTIGVKDETITEGDAIPTFTLTYDGWRNGDTEATAFTRKPTAKTTATSESKPGTYPITITVGTAKNYKITYKEGTLTIKEKPGEPVTIIANEITMVYGDEVPTLTYSTEGGMLNGTPKLSTTATKASPVGTYPIKVERGTVTNGQVTFVDGTLIISKAPLTIGVKDETITEGDVIPAFTLTYDGWRNGDTEATALIRKPTAKTTATSESKAGTYPITITVGTAKNYKITYKEGTLTIKEKESTSTWTNIVVNGDLESSNLSCFYKEPTEKVAPFRTGLHKLTLL